MPQPRVDPARLSGKELERWYTRSPEDIEAARRAQEERERDEFVRTFRPKVSGQQGRSAVDVAGDVLEAAQHGPKLPMPSPIMASIPVLGPQWQLAALVQRAPKLQRPSTPESFIPVVGPAWEAAADLQDGNYLGAAFNTGMAVLDAVPAGTVIKGIRATAKGAHVFKGASMSHNATRAALKRAGLIGEGEVMHHPIQLNGFPRHVADWRNNPALVKPLPPKIHKRIHGRDLQEGKPRFNAAQRAW